LKVCSVLGYAKVLAWLLTHPDERYFVRQLMGLLSEDSTNLSRELARRAKMGILTCQEEGRQKYYQVNRDSPVFEELRGLAVKTFAGADVLRQALTPLTPDIRLAFVFGSFAEAREDTGSDGDLAVIGDTGLAQVSRALAPAAEKLGREINPVVYPVAEFQSKLEDGHHFINSLLTAKRIFLTGDEDDLRELAEKPPSH
jgi:predicted nucleotidyltransferase